MIVPLLHAEAARADDIEQGWAGIVAGSNDYSHPVAYDTPAQACASHENSFVPRFGYQVYGLISVDDMGEMFNPYTGVNAPATGCRMDAGPNGTATIISLKGCSGGYKLVQGTCLPADYPVTAEPMCKGSKGGGGQFPAVGDPCALSSGTKFEEVTDYSSGGAYPIEIKRYYRSVLMPTQGTGMGLAWRNDLVGRRLRTESYDYSDPYNVVVSREDGNQSRFLNPNGTALGEWNQYSIEIFVDTDGVQKVAGVGGARDSLNRTGYRTLEYVDENDRVDTFSSAIGNATTFSGPTKSVWKGGYTRNYSYATDDSYRQRPIQISDSLGRVVNLTWTGNLITTITVPGGMTIRYTYEPQTVDGVAVAGTEVLTQVARYKADGTLIDSTGYQYDRSRKSTTVPLLTGVIDARNVQVDATTYDVVGRVLTAQGPGGANAVGIAYDDTARTRTVTNALGQVSVYRFSPDFTYSATHPILKLRSIARQASATVAAGSWAQPDEWSGLPITRTDWNGVVTNYSYDDNNNESQRVEDANGLARTTNTTWHPTLRVPTQIVSPNLTVNFGYDTAGHLIRREEIDTLNSRKPVSRVWTYTWNALGLLESETGPRTDLPQVIRYTYDAAGNLATVTDALNRVTRVNSVDASGRPTSITDANNVVTLMNYDPAGRIASVSRQGPVPATTGFAYDANGLLTTITAPNNVTLTYGYDDAHRLTSIRDGAGNAMAFQLDPLGNRLQTQVQSSSAQVLMANSATFDSLGRLLTSIGAASQTSAYQYDGNSNVTRLTDPRNGITQTAYDGLNRIKQTTDALNGVTKLAYDGQDNVTSVTDAKLHATSYTVNGFGFVTQVVSPDSGTTSYTYDLAGNVKTRTDARRIVTTYTYDALNRPLTRTFSTTAENVTYGYDATAGGNYGIGRLTSVTDAAGTASFTYDAYGNRISEKRTIGTNVYTTGYDYDLAGNLTRVTYPSGMIVNFQRDGLGNVSGVTMQQGAAGSPVTLASGIAYMPFGPLQSATLGNGIQLTNSFDLDYRLTRMRAAGAATVQDLSFGYNAAGHVNSVTDAVSAGLSQTFDYDLLGRVTRGTGGFGTDNYTYDAVGNRLTRSLVNGATTSTTYTYTSSNNQLATMTTGSTVLSFTYDANGARASVKAGKTVQSTLTYNSDARLATAGTASLKYNAFGERSIETVTGGGTHFIFAADGTVLAEHSPQGALVRNYVYLNGVPLALVDAAGTVSYVLNDHIGQPQKMLNASGAVIWHRVAGVYGESVSQPVGSLGSNPLRFPGQQHSAAAGFSYNMFRNYDPSTGRYLETDPLGVGGGINLYAYVGANPVNGTDPTGLQTIFEYYTGLPDSYRVNAMNGIAGWSDTLTFGGTDKVRDWLGINDEIDKCRTAYKVGEGLGVGTGMLAGGAGGLRAAGKAGAGREFSHWIPNRAGGPRSLFNGNYVTTAEHALSDPYRYRFMPRPWKEANPLPSTATQQWNRVPKVYKGAGAGAGTAAAGAAANGCDCQ